MTDATNNPINQVETGPMQKTYSEEKLRALILKKTRAAYVPSSVYRVQLNKVFTFQDAEKIVPYLHKLGIEAIYCSPFFQATAGSMHGYDVVRPDVINPEIGSMEDFTSFCNTLARHDMGLIADIVPNHMGVGGNDNLWWHDLLENGRSSLFANYFDIDWNPEAKELADKILLPVLGNFYGRVLENQELLLNYQHGEFVLAYFDRKFPIEPCTYPMILDVGDGALQKSMGAEDQTYQELLSIITAFKNLPPSYETNIEKMQERRREKEIAKQRLQQLVEKSEPIRKFIQNRVAFLNGIKGTPSSFDPLDQIINRQMYRLAYWAVASQEINYRRFFDINELAAIHTEDERVFQHYHEMIFQLIKEGRVNGLRVDHPDGLYDPPAYFRRLQTEYIFQMLVKEFEEEKTKNNSNEQIDADATRRAIGQLLNSEFVDRPGLYVAVEKILERSEALPPNWIVHGTVGYDYLNALNGLFVEKNNEEAFAGLYEKFIGHTIDYDTLVYDKKLHLSTVLMGSEINALGNRLNIISESNRNFRDFTLKELTAAIGATIAAFGVYRTYTSPMDLKVSERDEKHIRAAILKARIKTPKLNPLVYDFLQDVLLLRLDIDKNSEEMKRYQDFLLRFQQLTGPIMAKGVEDTSFYVYNRLVSLNEVGGDPFYFGYSTEDFHNHNMTRIKRWPCSMITTSTHDTKRSEDCRMRINVLSEIPQEWEAKLYEWSEYNKHHKTVVNGVAEPRGNTEYFIYQTLLGVLPDESLHGDGQSQLVERIWQYVLKSIREAKIYTDWARPDVDYESAVERFVRGILVLESQSTFMKSFIPFCEKISHLGKLNGLSATVLKISSPGVVDLYQGNETWNYSLVDPDNRRQIDFDANQSLLRKIEEQAFDSDLKVQKMYYTTVALGFRLKNKHLFIAGDYLPLMATGPKEHHVIAFMCKHDNEFSITAAVRFFSELGLDSPDKKGSITWGDTEILLPAGISYPSELKNIFTAKKILVSMRENFAVIRVADIFCDSYACIMTKTEGP